MNLYELSQPSKKKKTQLIKENQLAEYAPGGGGSGDYLRALASAWYNGVFDTGSLPKGIKTQEDVERLLNRGIVCPDGKTRKLHIDYNSDFDGVEIYSDDYYEHGDESGELDSRTGQPWGPYDHMEFKDEELDEGVAEGSDSYTVANDPDKPGMHSYREVGHALQSGHSDAAKIYKNNKFLGTVGDVRKQGVAEGHADQQRKIFKKNGHPVGEVGIDRESSPGNGQWYMKYYATGDDFVGYDSMEEAVADLKHLVNQFKAEGVAEGEGNLGKALDTLSGNWSGWHQVKSRNPNIEKFEWDDGEGGFYAGGSIEHNLKTGEVTVDYHGEYDDEVKGTFKNMGDAMRALRGDGGSHGGRAPNFDRLRDRKPPGPDDLRKTDRTGRKGTIGGGYANQLKGSIQANKGRLGPKGVLPEQGVAEGSGYTVDDEIQHWKDMALHWARMGDEKSMLKSKANSKAAEQKKKDTGAADKQQGVAEGWDDMVKDAKEKVKSGPQPNGGSGKKQGSAYGGSKQKDKPEHDDVKEGWEGSAKDSAEDKKEAKKRHMSMKEWEKSAADKKHDMKEAKTLSPGQDDAPFDGTYKDTPKVVKDKSGAEHTPMSRARNLARAALTKIKHDQKLG